MREERKTSPALKIPLSHTTSKLLPAAVLLLLLLFFLCSNLNQI